MNFFLQKQKSKFSTTFVLGIFSVSLIFSFFVNVPRVFAIVCQNNTTSGFVLAENGACPPGSIDTNQANSPSQIKGILGLLNRIIDIINLFIPFLVGLAVFLIIYGIFGFISSAGDEEKRKEARDFIMWGVIGVFLMLSVWGLINILVNTFGLDRTTGILNQTYPTSQLPTTAPKDLPTLIDRLNIIGAYVIQFLIGIAVFVIILGIFNYIREAQNEEKRAEARRFVIWGVIFVFLMLSIWGLVNILVNTLGFDPKAPGPQQLSDIFSHLNLTASDPNKH
jgi:uncharacterized membrane protein YidH (DUF202 family)